MINPIINTYFGGFEDICHTGINPYCCTAPVFPVAAADLAEQYT